MKYLTKFRSERYKISYIYVRHITNNDDDDYNDDDTENECEKIYKNKDI